MFYSVELLCYLSRCFVPLGRYLVLCLVHQVACTCSGLRVETANCQVGHSCVLCAKNSSAKKENREIQQFERWMSSRESAADRSDKVELYVPRVRVIDTGRW